MTTPYPVGPGKAAIAHFKAGGGAIGWAPGQTWVWSARCKIRLVAGVPYIGAVALTAALAQEISLNAAFPNNTFPTNVQCGQAYIKRVTDFSGGAVSAMSIQVGDTGNVDELVTAINIFTGALAVAEYTSTTGAATYAMHVEMAYVPTIVLTVITANLDQLTEGEVVVCIPIRPLHD